MRHAIGFGVVLLLVATGEGLAAGNQLPPCRSVSWVPTGDMTTRRSNQAAVLLPGGKVLVSGGAGGGATAELYDPVTGTWAPTGSMNIERFAWHTMTLLASGKVLVVGGASQQNTGLAELYDPDTSRWTITGEMLEQRIEHTATLLPSGKVLVVGGFGHANQPGPLASAELYYPATGEWQATGALSTGRLLHTATLLPSGKVLVLGGLSVGALTPSAELYDPQAGTWTPTAPMLAGRFGHTATLLGSGALLVAGGEGDSSSIPKEAELYDLATDAWRRTGSLPNAHSGHTATQLPSGRVLVVGESGFFPIIANTELFDWESETWSDAGCTGEARAFHTATLLPSGAVLVAGGSSDSSAELYGIIVSPALVSLAPGATQTFTVSGGSGLGYVWSFVHNESGGTLTASGDYQAGPMGGVTDVLQVVDSFANSSTATVNVLRQTAAVSSTGPQSKALGCDTTGDAALPSLTVAFLALLALAERPGSSDGLTEPRASDGRWHTAERTLQGNARSVAGHGQRSAGLGRVGRGQWNQARERR